MEPTRLGRSGAADDRRHQRSGSHGVSTVAGVLAVLAWQVVASACYYAVFAATASIRRTVGLSGFEIGVLLAALTLGYTLFLFPRGRPSTRSATDCRWSPAYSDWVAVRWRSEASARSRCWWP
ncbi:hypothetical protein VB773_05800 [Haloarculaceae archaeon H-GB2-1]|nr:hypothetical protein [Haloarculaceae archaeon H-GB2-1]